MRSLFLVVLLAIATSASASDAWLIRFLASGAVPGFESYSVGWRDDVLFFNTNAAPVDVHVLGVSNGAAQQSVQTLTLPPGRVVSLNAEFRVSETWHPVADVPPAVWVNHVDIPPGVLVESRDQFFFDYGIPELFPVPQGKVDMPIFRELAPANTPQVQLGTDLNGPASRENVGIYNAGTETASATIEVHRLCDDVVVDSRTLSIPPNTIVQTNGLGSGDSATSCFIAQAVMRYTVVTVSQPSLVYVANLSNSVKPAIPGATPIVGLAVAQQSKF